MELHRGGMHGMSVNTARRRNAYLLMSEYKDPNMQQEWEAAFNNKHNWDTNPPPGLRAAFRDRIAELKSLAWADPENDRAREARPLGMSPPPTRPPTAG